MRIKFEFQKYHAWFGYCKMPEAVRDLGDVVLFILKLQITIWWR